jgi:hypothetical protein
VLAGAALIAVVLASTKPGPSLVTFAPPPHGIRNGLRAGQPATGGGLDPVRAMIWKYVALCALRADQQLPPSPERDTAGAPSPRGLMGLAPEWLGGTCGAECREKVSACLLSLTNRGGRHVLVSLLSGAAGMSDRLVASDDDREFPYQEGAFFGDVFSGKAFACRGRDARKASQVKRFCALEPASCRGLFPFTDAGACEDVCETSCQRVGDGTERCPATVCRDPDGRAWRFPITAYLRNRIEADNADERSDGPPGRAPAPAVASAGDVATYRRVDFGPRPVAHHRFTARMADGGAAGRIQVFLASGRRLGVLAVPAAASAEQELSTQLATAGLSGPQDLTLRLSPGLRVAQLSTIELR